MDKPEVYEREVEDFSYMTPDELDAAIAAEEEAMRKAKEKRLQQEKA